MTSAKDVILELSTPVRAALVQAEAVEAEQRNLLAADGLTPSETRIYELLSTEESKPIDELAEMSGLNSGEVLATLFNLEMRGIVRQLPGKAVQQGIVVEVRGPPEKKMHPIGRREHLESSKEAWDKTYTKVARRTQTT